MNTSDLVLPDTPEEINAWFVAYPKSKWATEDAKTEADMIERYTLRERQFGEKRDELKRECENLKIYEYHIGCSRSGIIFRRDTTATAMWQLKYIECRDKIRRLAQEVDEEDRRGNYMRVCSPDGYVRYPDGRPLSNWDRMSNHWNTIRRQTARRPTPAT